MASILSSLRRNAEQDDNTTATNSKNLRIQDREEDISVSDVITVVCMYVCLFVCMENKFKVENIY